MRTEQEIIYTIWDTVRGGQTNQDDSITERLLRSYLKSHRGKHLTRNYFEGAELPEEVYQNLGEIPMNAQNNEYVSTVLPKTIRFKHNYGLIADISGYTLSIVSSEEFQLSKKDRFNKFIPMMKFVDNRLFLSKGKTQTGPLEDFSNSELNSIVDLLKEKFVQNNVTVNLRAVLVDPDDEPGYDYTKSPYPFPNELIEDLMNSVTARDFGLYLNTRSDETGDLRNDAKPETEKREF